ncbi:MAG: toxin-antitoxin system YwqK family antitoxin [Prevotellaceae bacterium]|jgi:antitoxin component YwqK of YwqJK toxin-antitoxin module|nr:toxin-antitoxin system YwqK family antitoxin [Prevotellaceae bacterium]
MKKLIVSLSFLISLSAFSQNITDAQGLKQGQWKKLYPNGQIMYEGTFKDDQPIGEMTRYYENGIIRSKQIFTPNSDISTAEHYNTEGNLFSKGTYKGQLREGEWQYFANDVKVMTEQFKDGKKNGVSKEFTTTGGVIDETNWTNDVRTGVRKRFFDDGKIYTEMTYDAAGILNGEAKMYFENTALATRGTYKDGKKEGKFEFFNPDGTPDFSFEARAGVITGQFFPDERQRQMLVDFEQQIEGITSNQE